MLKPLSLSIVTTTLLLAPLSVAQTVTNRAAARLLDQATWGPTPATIADVQTMGMSGWLRNQYSLNVSDIPDQPILDSNGNNNTNLGPVQQAFFYNAVNNSDQLRQRVAFALTEMWVISNSSVTSAYAYPPYWRVLRDNAFGNYRDIIKAVTLNPGMGRYLSMANNNKAVPSKGTAANENYARELMQLFTIGLTQLNMDGSPVLDASGNPVPTYTQAIVTSTAKALTGWTYPLAPGAKAANNNPAYYLGQMYAVEAEHDTTAKQIVGGVNIPAGQSTGQDLDSVIAALMAQPTMAPFVCRQLIQHLVTSNPSPAYIKRVAEVFDNDGTGVKGNMTAVITAILMDPEARAGDDPTGVPVTNFGHMREPILWVANLLRGLNATVTTSNSANGVASQMGQNLFEQATVFSYFSPDNTITPTLYGPEFQIYSTQTASYRADNVNTAIFGGSLGGSKLNLTSFTGFGANLGALMSQIDLVFMHSSMSDALRQQAMNAAENASSSSRTALAALYVVLSSSEYQIIQ